jgi:hypothetical protein
VRIDQGPGEKPRKIAFSFPLPLNFTIWVLRHFGRFIPHLAAHRIDELIIALNDAVSSDAPLYVDVDEDGERVQVFLG